MPKHQLCRNCGHVVDENYCPACGQRTTTHRLGWASLVESITSTFIGDEAYGLRGMHMRQGAITTWFSILVRPHHVIPEYIEGRRRKYFNPVTILLLLSTFYAIVFTLLGKEYTPTASSDQPMHLWIINSYTDYAKLHPAGLLLLTLPVMALAMKTVFRRRSDLHYVEYLYIGIFLAIFEITLMVLLLSAEALLAQYSRFYQLTLPVYLYTAFVLWKFFGLTKWGALLRTLLTIGLQVIYTLLMVLVCCTLFVVGFYFAAPEKWHETFVSNRSPHVEQTIENSNNALLITIQGIVEALTEAGEEQVEQIAPASDKPAAEQGANTPAQTSADAPPTP